MKTSKGWFVASAAVLAAFAGSYYFFGSDSGPGISKLYAQQVAEAESAERDLIGAERLSGAFRASAKVLKPSVVQISALVEQRQRAGNGRQIPFSSPFGNDLLDDLLGQLEGRGIPRERLQPQEDDFEHEPSLPRRKIQAGMGSGVIVSADGFVLTNNHVVAQADELQVELSDGRTFKAKVVGTDPKSDLAVLKIEADGLVPARLGDSSKVEVGDWVIAVGSPFGLEQTVTAGIISATNRRTGIIRGGYEDFLQTDAAINPGNSGGPLVNLHGEVIGINTAINSRTGTNAGVGFAIPSNMAVRIMQDLQETGRVMRGFIGASLEELTSENAPQLSLPPNVVRGAIIRRVLPNSPAAKAPLKENDVVVATNGRTTTSSQQLMNEVALTRPGSPVDLSVYRNGKLIDVKVIVEEQTEERMSQFYDRTQIENWGLVVDTLNPQIAQELDLPEGVEQGAVVLDVARNGIGARLGFQAGDVLLAIDGKAIRNAADAKQAFAAAGSRLSLQVQRGHSQMSITTVVPKR